MATVTLPNLGSIQPEGFTRSFVVGTGGVTQGYPVKLGTNANEIVAAGAGDQCEGIALQTKPAGQYVTVQIQGRCVLAVCAAALTGLYTQVAADGTTGYKAAVSTNHILGHNMTTTANAGDPFVIELYYPNLATHA